MEIKDLLNRKTIGNILTLVMFGMLLIAYPWIDKGAKCEASKNLVQFCEDQKGSLTCVYQGQNPNGFIPANQYLPKSLIEPFTSDK